MATPKGQTGNPRGGKPDKQMRHGIILALHREAEKGSRTKKLQRVADALVDAAINGDIQAIKEINDRVDGKVTQNFGGDPDSPLKIEIVKFGQEDG